MSDAAPAPEVEATAREMGWVPQEEFRGPVDKWIDAESFLERGERVMPLLRAQKTRLEGQLHDAKVSADATKAELAAMRESVKALMDAQEEIFKTRIAEERAKLRVELKAAREEGDVDRELEVQERLSDLKTQPQVPQGGTQSPAQAPDPDWASWLSANPWFGQDPRKTARAMGIANLMRADPKNDALVGRKFYDKVVEELEAVNRPTGKVDGAGSTRSGEGGPASGNGKTYASLPADAKAACERQAAKVVGPNKVIKDINEWRKQHATLYFAE